MADMAKPTPVKQIIAELVAELIVVFVKTFGTGLIAYTYGGIWASAFLGLFIFVTASVFTLQVNTITDPIVNLMLLIMKAIDNRDERKKLKMRTVIIVIVKIVIDVGVACLAGLALTWMINGNLASANFSVQNMFAGNGDWATGVLTAIVTLLIYHLVAFILNYSADGMAACLALGVTYAIASAFLITSMNAYFDYTVDIAIAIALGAVPSSIVGWFWFLLIILVGTAALTIGLYYLLWDMYFNADVMRAKRNEGTVNELTGTADEEHQELETSSPVVPSASQSTSFLATRSAKAMSALHEA